MPPIYHYEDYGTLLTPREVCEMTDLTLNQLRNWRAPARHNKAPFGFVQIGNKPLYRLDVIKAWAADNNGNNVRYFPMGIDHELPLESEIN